MPIARASHASVRENLSLAEEIKKEKRYRRAK